MCDVTTTVAYSMETKQFSPRPLKTWMMPPSVTRRLAEALKVQSKVARRTIFKTNLCKLQNKWINKWISSTLLNLHSLAAYEYSDEGGVSSRDQAVNIFISAGASSGH